MKCKYIPLIALMCLSSCQQDQPKNDTERPLTNPEIERVKTAQMFRLNISAEPENTFRTAQVVENATGKVLTPFLREKDLLVRLAIRIGKQVEYKTVRFHKETGRLRATYVEDIKLPQGVQSIEVAAIVLGEAGEDKSLTPVLPFAQVESDENKKHLVQAIPTRSELFAIEQEAGQSIVKSTLPYVSSWQTVQLETDENNHIDLIFKPSAALIRLRIKNEQSQAQTIKGIKIKTTAFVREWVYDFTKLRQSEANASTNRSPLLAGERLNGANTISEESFDLNLPKKIRLEPEAQSEWCYFWAMPVSLDAGADVKTEISLKIVSDTNPSEELEVEAWRSGHHFQIGATPIEVKLRAPKSSTTPDNSSVATTPPSPSADDEVRAEAKTILNASDDVSRLKNNPDGIRLADKYTYNAIEKQDNSGSIEVAGFINGEGRELEVVGTTVAIKENTKITNTTLKLSKSRSVADAFLDIGNGQAVDVEGGGIVVKDAKLVLDHVNFPYLPVIALEKSAELVLKNGVTFNGSKKDARIDVGDDTKIKIEGNVKNLVLDYPKPTQHVSLDASGIRDLRISNIARVSDFNIILRNGSQLPINEASRLNKVYLTDGSQLTFNFNGEIEELHLYDETSTIYVASSFDDYDRYEVNIKKVYLRGKLIKTDLRVISNLRKELR